MISPHALRRLLENGSAGFREANPAAPRAGAAAKLERDPRHEPLAADQAKKKHSSRLHVRITAIRKRLIDPDNNAGKFHLDCVRRAGFIRDDSAKFITTETIQRKAEAGESESVLIEVFEIL